jgi:hypothetical protein
MKFSNDTVNCQFAHTNPQTAAFMLSYGFSSQANSFKWARPNVASPVPTPSAN